MKTNPGATLLKPAKTPDSNYESPALTAELQARVIVKIKHGKPLVTNPESATYERILNWVAELLPKPPIT